MMSEKIDETLKNITNNMPSGKKTDPASEFPKHDLPGDPSCPVCEGVGFLRQDLPVGHPEFGKLHICVCRRGELDRRVHQRLFALSRLDELQHLNFDNFRPRGRVGLRPALADSLEQAYNQAQMFARSHKGWLLLYGGYGSGKTHLAAAIANLSVDLGIPTLFITVPDLLDTLRFSYDDPNATFEQRFEEIRNAPLLVMDDFGTQNATEWAQEKLFQILNFRYINKLPLVVTTNLLLEEMEPRIRSRLDDPELVTRVNIKAQDYRRPENDRLGHSVLSSSMDFLHKLTFSAFDFREKENLNADHVDSVKRAFDEARDFAEEPDGWLVLTGPYGCGKTHLAAAIANFRADQGYMPMFVVVPDLMDHLRATFGPRSSVSMDRLFEEVKRARLLILDDLGTQNMTPWAREKLYQLFNYRYNAELPTVITTPELKDEMDSRLLSRMRDTRLSVVCAITASSYRGTRKKRKKRKR
ncbi:MAG: ATP-binding protein [Chloroflexi bacterium]|nr:ATP-binding protein [Chloroflexota bacterium]MBL7162177.1 ATP-binding protein [Anaerolineales bacterium]